jgi:F5/8 type C domain
MSSVKVGLNLELVSVLVKVVWLRITIEIITIISILTYLLVLSYYIFLITFRVLSLTLRKYLEPNDPLMLSHKHNKRRNLINDNMNISTGLLAVFIVAVLISYALPKGGYVHIAGAASAGDQGLPTNIPQAFMIYNGHVYGMSPFVFAEGGQSTKIQFPALPDTVMPEVTLQEGSTINFDLGSDAVNKIVPNQAYAYVIDYEGDVNSLFPLKKVGQNSFELSGISGIKTLELHVLLHGSNDNSNVKYVSFTKLVNILGNSDNEVGNLVSPDQNGNSLNIGSSNTKDNSNPKSAQACSSASELNVGQVLSSPINSLNASSSSNTPSSTPLTWSATGEGSSIQLDLGQPKTVCSLEIAFANGNNSINFFNIQTSTDGVHFIDHGPFQNTGHISSLEQYNFSNTPVRAKFVKLTFQGSTQVDSYNIADLKVLGIE